jgi:hypothetical protein
MTCLPLNLIVLALMHCLGSSFIVPAKHRQPPPKKRFSRDHPRFLSSDTSLRIISYYYDDDARVDVRNLLTQRSIQSFMYLCENLRDPHTVSWLEDFLETRNALEFHGTGAGYIQRLGGTWVAPLLKIAQADPQKIIIKAKRRGRGHGGWSKDNPYLEERFVEFEIDLDPVSIANRILSVREQIAKEWEHDIEILKIANSHIMESYFHGVVQNSNDLSSSTTPSTPAFERTAALILQNYTSFSAAASSSSSMRKGSFDLLYNLVTQASIHRLLRLFRDDESASAQVSFHWLLAFYNSTVADYFDGDLKYGRADDWMEKLLQTSPRVLVTARNGKDDTVGGETQLVDPLRIAEEIIAFRNVLCEDWKKIMESVPQDHSSSIRKILLNKQLEKWGAHQEQQQSNVDDLASFE